MKKALMMCICILLLAGHVLANDFSEFIGTWMVNGEEAIIIREAGDFIELEFPKNPVWRAEFQNIRMEGSMLKYEQLHYAIVGGEHPFDGVVNYMEMWKDDDGKWYLKAWADIAQDIEPVAVEIIKVE